VTFLNCSLFVLSVFSGICTFVSFPSKRSFSLRAGSPFSLGRRGVVFLFFFGDLVSLQFLFEVFWFFSTAWH